MTNEMNGERIFAAWLREGSLAGHVLVSGVNLLHESASAPSGVFSNALFNLSIGFERMGKLVVMLDHYIESDGGFLTDKELRARYGHKIVKLFSATVAVCERRGVSLKFEVPRDPIHTGIIAVLADFAQTARYYNLDYLGTKGMPKDKSPEIKWQELVGEPILARHYSTEQEEEDKARALVMDHVFGGVMFLSSFAPDGRRVDSINETFLHESRIEVIANFGQFYTLQIVRFYVEVFMALEGLASSVPNISEILGVFYNSDDLLMERKQWKLY